MGRLQELGVSLLERLPFLGKPAHLLYATAFKARYATLSFRVRRFGYLPRSLSDRGQDAWVIHEVFPGKRDGFFLELGAADGFSGSNTYVLEKRHGWKGICIEPNPALYERLVNRTKRECLCVAEAVDGEPGQVEFVLSGHESGVVSDEADHSAARRGDRIEEARDGGRMLVLESQPLDRILDKYDAPKVIDYFSFDVEGLETRILRNFPFDRYTFLAMTVERPTPELNALLFANGYHFVRNSLYDSFYVHESLPNFDTLEKHPFVQVPPKNF